MKLRKILMGTTCAFLFGSTAAYAVTAAPGVIDPLNATAGGPVTDVATTLKLASEAALTGAALNGDFGLVVTRDLAVGEDYRVDISVAGGTFTSTVNNASITIGASTNNAGGTESLTASVVPNDAGGASGLAGSTSVRYLVSANGDTADTINSFNVALPVTYAGCPAAQTFTVTVSQFVSGGVQVLGSTTVNSISCVDAAAVTVVADTRDTKVNADTKALVANATPLVPPVAANVDTVTTGFVGLVTSTLDLTAVRDLAATPVASGDFPSASLVVTPSGNIAGITDIGTVAPAAGVVTIPTLALDYTVAPLNVGTALIPITVRTAANGGVEAQTLAASGLKLNQNAALYAASGLTGADAALDALDLSGASCAGFDWVGSSATGTVTNIRATGVTGATDITATISNAKNTISGDVANTTRSIFSNVAVSPGGVVNITSNTLASAFGSFGNADFDLNFIGAKTGVDCDRLLISSPSNAIAPFGNEESPK